MSEEDSIYTVDADKKPVHVIVKKTFNCGGCGSHVETIFTYCPHCGRKLIWKFTDGNQ